MISGRFRHRARSPKRPDRDGLSGLGPFTCRSVDLRGSTCGTAIEKNMAEREANYQGMDYDQLVTIVEKAKKNHLLDRDNNLETDDFRVLADRHRELAVTWNRPEQFEQDVIDDLKPSNVVEVYEDDEPLPEVDWTPSPHSRAGKDIKALEAMWARQDRLSAGR